MATLTERNLDPEVEEVDPEELKREISRQVSDQSGAKARKTNNRK